MAAAANSKIFLTIKRPPQSVATVAYAAKN
jgi:hypothetical protein